MAAIVAHSFGESSIVLVGVEISGNNAGPSDGFDEAAISSSGTLQINRSTITGNSRAAIVHLGEFPATIIESTIAGTIDPTAFGSAAVLHAGGEMRIERSLIANNEMTGIEIDSDGSLEIVNSTISGNAGGGVTANHGELVLRFVTIAENGNYGVFLYAERGTASVESSLIAANGREDCGFYPWGTLNGWDATSGSNIDSDDSCSFPETYGAAILRLGPLADNSGPTWTHALQVGSPAIDAITEGCISEDQRNLFRPINGACDVGAFEYHFAVPGFIG
ncbi:MAG: choice-of-anchor Q domain-containing protein, partial [Anaerolineales bacterium]